MIANNYIHLRFKVPLSVYAACPVLSCACLMRCSYFTNKVAYFQLGFGSSKVRECTLEDKVYLQLLIRKSMVESCDKSNPCLTKSKIYYNLIH